MKTPRPLLIAFLAFAASSLLASNGWARRAPKRHQPTMNAFLMQNGTLVEGCDQKCLARAAAAVRKRRGVRKAVVKGEEIELEVLPGVFRAEEAVRGIEGFKVEMRIPYKRVELRFVEHAPFPPWPRLESDVLIIEFNAQVRDAFEAGLAYKPNPVMKCVGKVTSSAANEAVLTRYEEEKRPPLTMIAFMTEGDFDGDRRPDVYLRLEGLGEVFLFNKKEGIKAVSPKRQQFLEEIPRCDQDPTRFARTIPKRKVRCEPPQRVNAKGDAIERVAHNRTSKLLAWNGEGFEECDAYGGDGPPPEAFGRDESSGSNIIDIR